MKIKIIIVILFLFVGISSQAQTDILNIDKPIRENIDYAFKKADRLKSRAINEGEVAMLRVISTLMFELNEMRSLLSQDLDKKLRDVNGMVANRLTQIDKILNDNISEINKMMTNQVDVFYSRSTDFLNDLARVFGRSVDLYPNKMTGLEQSIDAYGAGYQINVNFNKTPSSFERENIKLLFFYKGQALYTVKPSVNSGNLSKITFKIGNQYLDKYFQDTRVNYLSVKLQVTTIKREKKVLKDDYLREMKEVEAFMFLLPKYPYQFKLVQKTLVKKEVIGTKPISMGTNRKIIAGGINGKLTTFELTCHDCKIIPNSIQYSHPNKTWKGKQQRPIHRHIKWQSPVIKNHGINGQILEVSVDTRFRRDYNFWVTASYYVVTTENTLQTYTFPIQYASNGQASSQYFGYGEYHTQTAMNGFDQYELILIPTVSKSSVKNGKLRLITGENKAVHPILGTVEVVKIGSFDKPSFKIVISKPVAY